MDPSASSIDQAGAAGNAIDSLAPIPAKPPPSLRSQAFWLTAAKVISVLINIALPVLLVRVLSQTQLGLYRQVFLYAASVVSLSTLGVGTSAFYFMPRHPGRGGQIAFNILLYNLLTGLIPFLVLLFYPRVLSDVLHVPALEPYAFSLGVLILLMLPATFLEVLPTALRDVKSSTIMIVGVQFTKTIAFAGAALLYPSVESLLAVGIFHQFIQLVVLLRYIYIRFGNFWAQFEWSFFRHHIGYALSVGMFGGLSVVKRDIHNYFVSASFSPAEFAIYSIGCVKVPLARVFVDSIVTVVSIRASELQSKGAHREILDLTARAINRLAAIQFPIAAALLVMGRDLIVLMYTSAYERSADIFAVNILFLIAGVLLVDPIFRAYKELLRYLLVVRLTVLIGLVISLYFSIQQLGLVGAIVASLVAALIERFALTWRGLKKLGMTAQDLPLFADLLKVSVVTVITGLIAYVIRAFISSDALVLRIAVTGFSFAAMYGAALMAFRLPGSEELRKERMIAVGKRIRSMVNRLRNRA